MVIYNSSEDFTLFKLNEISIKNDNKKSEKYTNEDYNRFVLNQTVSKQEPSNLLNSKT